MALQEFESGKVLGCENGYRKQARDSEAYDSTSGAVRQEAGGPGGEDYLEIPTFIRRGISLSCLGKW